MKKEKLIYFLRNKILHILIFYSLILTFYVFLTYSKNKKEKNHKKSKQNESNEFEQS